MGITPPITFKHYRTYNQRLRDATDPVREQHDGHSSPHHIQALRDLQPETEDATDPVREANMSAVDSCLRKDAAPDEVVMALGLSEATQLSLEWWSWLPGSAGRAQQVVQPVPGEEEGVS